ncbi:hypothetical protein [Acrocarpospora sp. B8E8]|uniref:hypothetical protein n=1 Tax=Acrocarpospora sp. B8E8 TaxID=3153572 RepID=UPI00325C8F9A
MAYQGPAVVIGDGQEVEVFVTLRANTSGPLKSWGGSGEPVAPGIPAISMDMSTIRLPDGREGEASVQMSYDSRLPKAQLEIIGSGPPPFD